MRGGVRFLVLVLALAACGRNLDSQMWECQLTVQKGNAGHDAAAARERAHDIEACMEERGFRLNSRDSACQSGSADSSCYRAK